MDTKNPELIVQLDQARPPIELRLAESLKRGYAFPYSAGLFSPERPEISLRRPSGLFEGEIVPFKLSISNNNGTLEWRVSSNRSSITDGTNGDAVDLSPTGADWATGAVKFDVDTAITATKYIVLKASVDPDLEVTDWTLAAVNAADAVEVGTDAGPPITQDEIRLLIGKVTIDTAPDPDVVSVSQAVFSPQMITYGLTNGLPSKVFASAPIQIDNL